MLFRRLLWAFCLAVMLANVARVPLGAQSGGNAPAPVAAATAPAPANLGQAYTLSPDKLAKAIALSRIRNILDISESIWGIVVLWLLLAMRGWSGLERWTEKISGKRWVQGVVFFAAFFVITGL